MKQEALRREPQESPSFTRGRKSRPTCASFTAQGAFNLGYRPTVVAEACATRPLAGPDGAPIAADALHAAALTTIGDLFGPVAARVADLPD
ncbi:hypothetical protein GCM10023195_32300 [Actinoallomurus liliacearum]|uniref:Uncharacterized protein n=1 Tax=Actinoallomurus liliacearum TaxID=1080073 RepID=A0ABP8THN5_9ACTN